MNFYNFEAGKNIYFHVDPAEDTQVAWGSKEATRVLPMKTGSLKFPDDEEYTEPAPTTEVKGCVNIEELANRCSTAQEFFEKLFSKKTYEVNEQNVVRTTLIKHALNIFNKSFYLNGMKDRLFIFPYKRNPKKCVEYATTVALKNLGILKQSKYETQKRWYLCDNLIKFCDKKETYYSTGFFNFVYNVRSVKEYAGDDFIRIQGTGKFYGSKSAISIIKNCPTNPVSRSRFVRQDILNQACGIGPIVDRWIKINYPDGFYVTAREFKDAVKKFREYTKDLFEWDRVEAWKEHARQLEKEIFKR